MHFKTLLIVVAIVLFTSISYLLTAQTVIPTNYYGITAQDVTASIPANSTTLLKINAEGAIVKTCLLYTSPSPRDLSTSRMPSSA